jgi:hypothetical protein
MKTPKRLLGPARRISRKAGDKKEEELIDDESTPTLKSVNKYEFNAPQYHDFGKEDQEGDSSAFFGISSSKIDLFRGENWIPFNF